MGGPAGDCSSAPKATMAALRLADDGTSRTASGTSRCSQEVKPGTPSTGPEQRCAICGFRVVVSQHHGLSGAAGGAGRRPGSALQSFRAPTGEQNGRAAGRTNAFATGHSTESHNGTPRHSMASGACHRAWRSTPAGDYNKSSVIITSRSALAACLWRCGSCRCKGRTVHRHLGRDFAARAGRLELALDGELVRTEGALSL